MIKVLREPAENIVRLDIAMNVPDIMQAPYLLYKLFSKLKNLFFVSYFLIFYNFLIRDAKLFHYDEFIVLITLLLQKLLSITSWSPINDFWETL